MVKKMSECTCGQQHFSRVPIVRKTKAGGRAVKKAGRKVAAPKKGGRKPALIPRPRVKKGGSVTKKLVPKRGGGRPTRIAGCAECGCSRVGGCGCGELPVEYVDADEN